MHTCTRTSTHTSHNSVEEYIGKISVQKSLVIVNVSEEEM